MDKPILKQELDVKIEGVQKVTNNINEIKEYAIAMKEYYSKLVFSDEQVGEATKERASVNKIVKKIADYRKNIVTEFNKPLDEFIISAKETENMLKEASNCIDVQVKKYENEEKEKKKKSCIKVFDEKIGDLKDLISFENVFDVKWLNKTTKLTQVEEDIERIINKVNDGIGAIKELNSEYETELINTFLNGYDLSKAIMKNTQLKEQKEAIEKSKVAKEETKKEIVKEMISKPIETTTNDNIKTYTLKITAGFEQLTQLRKFMEINKIKFEKVG